MKTPTSRLAILVPAFVLVLIGVASVAFAWGASSGGHPAGPPAMPAAVQSGAPQANSSTAPGNPRFGGPVGQAPVVGTVASKTDTAIVVTTTAGKTVTVNVSAATTYSVRGIAAATLANIAVGDRIAAQGTLNTDGSLNATVVQSVNGLVGPGGGRRGFGGGSGGRGGQPVPSPSGPSV